MMLRVDGPVSLALACGDGIRADLDAGVRLVAATEVYEGSYEVRPEVAEQVLPTEGKTMRRDLTVRRIPRYEVSNGAGGTTFSIGAEIGD